MKIEDKIRTARTLYDQWSGRLRADPAIRGRLKELAELSRASGRMSVEAGVSEACRRCDEQEGGSCCGAGIENRYTPEMLLINLLLGASLPASRFSDKSCWFLGEGGCVLAARDILCINYLCTRLRKEIPREDLLRLQEANGREMEVLFVLHDGIKRRGLNRGE